MIEAKNFVEKELGKTLDEDTTEQAPAENKESVPIYTPPTPQTQEPKMPEPQIVIQQPPVIQIVEKVVYKKQRIHGFFRTLTIIALLAIGFLMLGESTGMISLSINSFKLHQIFPIVIILSTIIIRSYRGLFGKIFGLIIFLAVWGGMFTISLYTSLNPSSKRKSGESITYTLPEKGGNEQTNIYLETLIGNSYIEGIETGKNIIGVWNSDRNLFVDSGIDGKSSYLKLTEDSNRNLLDRYNSNLDLSLPQKNDIQMLYIKNFIGLHTIDLTTFDRNMLKIHAGLDDLTIRVGNVISGNKIEIQSTAASIEMDIPDDVGVYMYYKHLAGMFKASGFDALSGHYFQSQNIKDAKSILNIYLNLGADNTKINRVTSK